MLLVDLTLTGEEAFLISKALSHVIDRDLEDNLGLCKELMDTIDEAIQDAT